MKGSTIVHVYITHHNYEIEYYDFHYLIINCRTFKSYELELCTNL